jgi:hypothetical protein
MNNSKKFILDKINSKIKNKSKTLDIESKVKKIVMSYISEAEMLIDKKVPYMAAECIALIQEQLRAMDSRVKIEVVTMNKVLNIPETINIVWSESFQKANNLAPNMIVSTMDNLFD